MGGMPEKKLPLGPTGERVRTNVKRARLALNMTYAQLSARLAETGRPIAPLGLSRLEAGERRVDADDLVALCLVLKVTPGELLAESEDDSEWIYWTPEVRMTREEAAAWTAFISSATIGRINAELDGPQITQAQLSRGIMKSIDTPAFVTGFAKALRAQLDETGNGER
jgi:transcriptional regulator with XRE-family HTH domain